jgi:hypothetical protein
MLKPGRYWLDKIVISGEVAGEKHSLNLLVGATLVIGETGGVTLISQEGAVPTTMGTEPAIEPEPAPKSESLLSKFKGGSKEVPPE